MSKRETVEDYINALKEYDALAPDFVTHRVFPEKTPKPAQPDRPFSGEVRAVMEKLGIGNLYSHQAEAVNHVRAGRNIVVATPTASGKTLTYNLPVLEAVLDEPETRALYLFPLKALAQDQLKGLEKLFSCFDKKERPSAAIYDGDTTRYKRSQIRKSPPNILLSNPDMIHLSILPYHDAWSAFFRNLKYVVVDEVHTYRGVMGSHMAWVFRRLLRICRYYGSEPVFIFCSATISNPDELAEELTDLTVDKIDKTGAPVSEKHFVLLNGMSGAAQTAIQLLHAALHREFRTIIYSQSRKMTELISLWASSRAGKFSEKISAYRAGYLPEERREIEAKLSSGELLAVVSTSALELGIDIGELDLCILAGYPGTIMATWQRAGRVGRRDRKSAVILIAYEDALDQYIVNNPDEFFNMPPETAVINPHNPVIMERHLECAAAELPLKAGEPLMNDGHVINIVSALEKKALLYRSADGGTVVAARKYPQRNVALRGTGRTFKIHCRETGEHIGEMDSHRVFYETHPGAVYIHRGRHYVVQDLDIDNGAVFAVPSKVHYFTKARSNKNTEILEVLDQRQVWSTRICVGRLKVTDHVTGYEKRLIKGQRFLGIVPLDLPPVVFETVGIWVEVPESVQREMEDGRMHFMGGIHAFEHAAIGILPLMVMADRNDLGGISIPFHPQVGRAAVFVYDGMPGGVGLARQAFYKAEEVLERTLGVIVSCRCENGCPACVHSPKCGSGNRPIDKHAARVLLEKIKRGKQRVRQPFQLYDETLHVAENQPGEGFAVNKRISAAPERFGVLDLETRRSAQEVGDWGKAHLMGVSCVVVYDSLKDEYVEYEQDDIPDLLAHLKELDLVVGFNIKRFDYHVLRGQTGFDFKRLNTLDLLEVVYKRLSYRLSLDHLAKETLGAQKSADGLLALKWWKEGRLREIIDYCRQDVKVTKDLYLFGRDNGFLLFRNKAGMVVRVPVEWA